MSWQPPPPALTLCIKSLSYLFPYIISCPHIQSSSTQDDQTKADIVTAHLCHSPRFFFLLSSPSHLPKAPSKGFRIEFEDRPLRKPTPEDFSLNIFSPASLDVSLTIVWLMARAQRRKWAQPQSVIQYEF